MKRCGYVVFALITVFLMGCGTSKDVSETTKATMESIDSKTQNDEEAVESEENDETAQTSENKHKSNLDIVKTLKDYGSSGIVYELTDAQTEFISDHLDFFPATYENLDELSKYIDETLDYDHMYKNPTSFTGKLALIDGLTVDTVYEQSLEGGGEYDYASEFLMNNGFSGSAIQSYHIIYMGKSTPLVKGDKARIVAMPIANRALTLTMVAALVEDSSLCEITDGYFSQNPSMGADVGYANEAAESLSGDMEEASGYIIPDSDSRYIDRAIDLSGLSKEELRLARNEIYARHGRIFSDPSLQEYFESQSWYIPAFSAEEFNEDCLNSYEKENLLTIKDVEKNGV